MTEGNLIGPQLLDRIRRAVSYVERLIYREFGPDNSSDHHQAAATYIARRPNSGVPARKGKRLGKARCEIWRSVPIAYGSTIRDAVPNIDADGTQQVEWVYNWAEEPITAEYFLVHQDKFDGQWYVDCPCGPSTSDSSSSDSSSSDSSSSDSSSSDSSSSDSSSSDISSSDSSSSDISSSDGSSSDGSSSDGSSSDARPPCDTAPPNLQCELTWANSGGSDYWDQTGQTPVPLPACTPPGGGYTTCQESRTNLGAAYACCCELPPDGSFLGQVEYSACSKYDP